MASDYVKMLEKENEILNEKLAHFDLIYDILNSKVNVIRSDLYNKISPYDLCNFLEKHGWKMRYEKQHERYLTRCYVSCKKDIKLKIHLKDTNDEASRSSDISKRIRIAIETFCQLHNKGQLQVVFDILRESL